RTYPHLQASVDKYMNADISLTTNYGIINEVCRCVSQDELNECVLKYIQPEFDCYYWEGGFHYSTLDGSSVFIMRFWSIVITFGIPLCIIFLLIGCCFVDVTIDGQTSIAWCCSRRAQI